MKSTTKFCFVISCALTLASAIVFATCGLAYGFSGGNCQLTKDQGGCYFVPYGNGGCKGNGTGNCTSKPYAQPILTCKYIPSSPPVCTPSKKIASQNVLSGMDLSGLCGG